MSRNVRVMRYPFGSAPRSWLVVCTLCSGRPLDGFGGLLFALGGPGIKGAAADWQTAQDYADRHARAHEATRCPTCDHVPAEVIDDVKEATA